ncbi:DUF294 nucleotidyltransferase-like domain-containing protein [Candidatus Protochlamydia amoebophila]|uniref:Uncharacterized protein n=1 Tax=Candidatus Protochlamydia amoebophila TaxID=362787 RepID=A0A0C1JKN2_9BACT|nr:DUF294 nucleotidyltransferase-like domain-containing protein [Candidatus Protochlamydia amoebophila]KIC71116.1 hypothetical protein DB44_ER00450 [Candidatus Protochlamydia amoebophila]
MQITHSIPPIYPIEQPLTSRYLASLKAIEAATTEKNYFKAIINFKVFIACLSIDVEKEGLGVEKEVLEKAFLHLKTLVSAIQASQNQKVIDPPQEIKDIGPQSLGKSVEQLLNLTADPCFAQNQQQLASELAKWHYKKGKQAKLGDEQFKYFIDAIHYIGKAQIISEASAALQSLASRLFKVASTSLAVFKQRLELAVGRNDSQQVIQLVTDLETRFKPICCEVEKRALIKLFYKQVQEVTAQTLNERELERIWTNGLYALNDTKNYYLTNKFVPTDCFITTKYRTALNTYRKNFHTLYQTIDLQNFTIEEVRAFQKKVSEYLLTFLHTLVEDAIAILGDPPCSYDLRAMGSLAKEEICPYSDLEWCILIEAIEHRPYFVKLARLLELQIIGLGENPAKELPVFTCIGVKHRSGFHIDSGGNPAFDTDLIHTPDGLAQMQKMEEYSSNSHSNTLRKTISFHQNNLELCDSYQKRMRTYLDKELPQAKEIRRRSQALQLLTDRLKTYEEMWHDPFQGQVIDLKKHYSELLNHFLNDLSLYFRIKGSNTLDLIDNLVKKKYLTSESGFLLQEAVAAVYLKRVGLHFKHKEQKEEVSLEELGSERKIFEKVYWLVLRPLYRKLKHGISKLDSDFQYIDLFQGTYYDEELQPGEVENLKPWMTHFVHHLVSRQRANALDPDQAWLWHEAYYQRLSHMTFAEPLREIYLNVLNSYPEAGNLAALSVHLASIPNPNGIRQSQRLEEEQFKQAILAMTTDQPDPDDFFQVKIRCPAVPDVQYLNQAVCEQILEVTGNLKRQYKNSAHPVARASYGGYQLHFKQKPTHPLLEYAIHALTARIAGHLSPPTQLARFEVDIKGKKRIYPVLISKTIQGQTLENAKNLDVKQLTWACLCALLTRPGDGRFPNYVVEEGTRRIFCVDNDISFVEAVIHYYFGHKVQFSSALFCLDAKYHLDSEVLEAFIHFKPNLILNSWLEDLIQKDESYRTLQLFTTEEEKRLYEEDSEDRFKGTLLLRSGTVTNLLVQFYHLQDGLRQALKAKKKLTPLDLLAYLVTLRGSQMQTLDRWVYSKYKQVAASSLAPKQRLQNAIDRQVDISLTSAQADAASFGKPPTFEEIQQRKEYSPEKAQSELFAFTLNRCASHVLFGENQEEEWIEADFKRMAKGKAPDRERQRLVLNALIFLMKNKGLRPKKVTLMNCAVLDHATLKPFLHIDLDYLNVSGCPLIKEEAIQEIEKRSPNLKQLYLNRCAQLRTFEKPNYLFASTYLQFAKLEELQLKRCVALTSIHLDAPLLHTLKADKNPHLKTLFFKTSTPYLKGSFTSCPALNLETATKEGVGRILKEIKNPKIDPALLIRIYMNDPKLNWLDFFDMGISDKEAEVIANGLAYNTTLKILSLCDNQISDKGLRAFVRIFASNTTLKELNLSANKINCEGAVDFALALASNTALESLIFRFNKIGYEGTVNFALALASNTTLKFLNLEYNQISNKGTKMLAQALASNTTLKKLDLSGNEISDKGAEAIGKVLASNTALRELHLNNNQISYKGAEEIGKALASNITLKIIYLNTNKISDEGSVAFAQVLASNTALRELHLNNNQIRYKGAEEIGKALASNTALKKLDLSGNQISDKGAEVIGKVLASNTTLETLSFGHNQISDKGAEVIAQALAFNTALKKLDLSVNQISDKGAEVIAQALASNTALKKLDLSVNQISDKGAEAIGKALASNTALRELHLKDNQISDKGAEIIAQALASNTTLETLSFGYNQISDKGAEVIAQALVSNTALSTLYLDGNQISDKRIEILAKVLTSNTALKKFWLNGNLIKQEGVAVNK